jgi:hypothetical protein
MYGYVQGCHLMSLVATVMAEGVLRSTAAKCQKSIRTPGKRNLEFKKSSIFGCFLRVQVVLPVDYLVNETLVGLLGTPNGDDSDDWVDRNGNVVEQPVNETDFVFKAAYEYCRTNWCIENESDSLFTYSGNESFESISGCSVGYDSDFDLQAKVQACSRYKLVEGHLLLRR